MRKLVMVMFAALILTVSVSAAYAEPPDPCYYDDFVFFLNPQPLPPG